MRDIDRVHGDQCWGAIVEDTYGLRLWSFGGGKANNLLAQCLEERLGEKVVVYNLYVAFRGQAATSAAAIAKAIAELKQEQRPNDADALRLAENCARGRLSKCQRCLAPRLESAFLAEVLTDPEAARLAIASTTDYERSIQRQDGRRLGEPFDSIAERHPGIRDQDAGERGDLAPG